jgi:hypothetical protein
MSVKNKWIWDDNLTYKKYRSVTSDGLPVAYPQTIRLTNVSASVLFYKENKFKKERVIPYLPYLMHPSRRSLPPQTFQLVYDKPPSHSGVWAWPYLRQSIHQMYKTLH